jgi:hypothetical protein
VAGREEIRVDVVATDKASDKLDDVADKGDRLEADPVDVEVTADTSAAEAGLRKKEDTTTGVKNLGKSSDQSRSVLANMTGNSAQDLGALGGVAGSAGVAVGQLAEYAADGNIALKGLAATAVPLLAVGIAMQGISKNAERVRKAKAFDTDQVKTWLDALKEGETAVEAIADSFREAGKVEANIGGHLLDVTGALQVAGVNAEQYAQLVAGGEDAVTSWAASMRAAGADTQAVNVIAAAARASFDELAEAEAGAATSAGLLADRQAQVRDALERTTESTERATTAQHEWLDAQLAAVDASFAHHDALRDFEAAVRDTATAMADGESTTADLEDAYRRERQAALDAAAAAARLAEEQARQAGGSLGAEERLDALNESLLESARVATPAARDQIAQYLAELNGIPAEEATEIIATADTAAASRALDEAANPGTKPRPAWIAAAVDPTSLSNAQRAFNQAIGGWGGFSITPAATVTVNVPQGSRPDDVIAAAVNYARRNGGQVLTRGRRRR